MSAEASSISAAIRAVQLAGVACRNVQRNIANVRALLKDDKSPVTLADLASQAVVAHTLSSALGSIALVAEEDAAAVRADPALLAAVVDAVKLVWPEATGEKVVAAIDMGRHDPLATPGGFWTLDPIDGTKGFLRGEQYAVSLAWVEGSWPVLGVLGCPNLSADLSRPVEVPDPDAVGSFYFATRGGGAFEVGADGSRRRISRAALAAGARLRLCESVESGHTKHDAAAEIMSKLGERGESARLDSQAKYAVVARGQADVYLRMPTKKGYVERIWDHAAGCLIAVEAGCRVSDVAGAALDFAQGRGLEKNLGVVLAAAEVHQRIIEVIGELGLAKAP